MHDEHIFLIWSEKYLNESACVANNLSVKLQEGIKSPYFISAKALMKFVKFMTIVKNSVLESHNRGYIYTVYICVYIWVFLDVVKSTVILSWLICQMNIKYICGWLQSGKVVIITVSHQHTFFALLQHFGRKWEHLDATVSHPQIVLLPVQFSTYWMILHWFSSWMEQSLLRCKSLQMTSITG